MKTLNKVFGYVLTFLFLFFSLPLFTATNFCCKKLFADFTDEMFLNQTEIFSRQFDGYTSDRSSLTPIDPNTGDYMEGYSIAPQSNSYGEVSLKNYQVNEFDLCEGESVFVWFYIPHNMFYELNVIFSGDGENQISWSFEDINGLNLLINFIEDGETDMAGWKLFELKIDDGEIVGQTSNLTSIKISYLAEDSEVQQSPIRGSFGFYHIFKADSLSTTNNSGIIYSQAKVIAIFSEEFKNFIKSSLFVGDKYKFTKNKILTKLYVDDLNVLNSSTYSWKIVIKNEKGFTDSLVLGDEYEFNKTGNYSITLTLTNGTKLIYSKVFSIECENLSLGNVSSGDLYLIKDEERTIIFNVSQFLEIQGEIDIYSTNKSVADLTYYEQDGSYVVKVKAKKSGITEIVFSASAKRESEDVFKLYTYSTAVNVTENANFSQFYLKLLLFFSIGLIISIILYTLILFVKSRRFVVK